MRASLLALAKSIYYHYYYYYYYKRSLLVEKLYWTQMDI